MKKGKGVQRHDTKVGRKDPRRETHMRHEDNGTPKKKRADKPQAKTGPVFQGLGATAYRIEASSGPNDVDAPGRELFRVDDSIPGGLSELAWRLYEHLLNWVEKMMPDKYSAREVLTVIGIAFGKVSFLVVNSSQHDVKGSAAVLTGGLTDVPIKGPMAELLRRHCTYPDDWLCLEDEAQFGEERRHLTDPAKDPANNGAIRDELAGAPEDRSELEEA
jgi:hypothetical protein